MSGHHAEVVENEVVENPLRRILHLPIGHQMSSLGMTISVDADTLEDTITKKDILAYTIDYWLCKNSLPAIFQKSTSVGVPEPWYIEYDHYKAASFYEVTGCERYVFTPTLPPPIVKVGKDDKEVELGEEEKQVKEGVIISITEHSMDIPSKPITSEEEYKTPPAKIEKCVVHFVQEWTKLWNVLLTNDMDSLKAKHPLLVTALNVMFHHYVLIPTIIFGVYYLIIQVVGYMIYRVSVLTSAYAMAGLLVIVLFASVVVKGNLFNVSVAVTIKKRNEVLKPFKNELKKRAGQFNQLAIDRAEKLNKLAKIRAEKMKHGAEKIKGYATKLIGMDRKPETKDTGDEESKTDEKRSTENYNDAESRHTEKRIQPSDQNSSQKEVETDVSQYNGPAESFYASCLELLDVYGGFVADFFKNRSRTDDRKDNYYGTHKIKKTGELEIENFYDALEVATEYLDTLSARKFKPRIYSHLLLISLFTLVPLGFIVKTIYSDVQVQLNCPSKAHFNAHQRCKLNQFYQICFLGNTLNSIALCLVTVASGTLLALLLYGADVANAMTTYWVVRFLPLRRLDSGDAKGEDDIDEDVDDPNKSNEGETAPLLPEKSPSSEDSSLDDQPHHDMKFLSACIERDAYERYLFTRNFMIKASQSWGDFLALTISACIVGFCYGYTCIVYAYTVYGLVDGGSIIVCVSSAVTFFTIIYILSYANAAVDNIADGFTFSAKDDYQLIGKRSDWIEYIDQAPIYWYIFGFAITRSWIVSFVGGGLSTLIGGIIMAVATAQPPNIATIPSSNSSSI